MYDDMTLMTAHRLSIYNRQQITDSKLCGCFHCLKKFPSAEITDWVDKGETPLCPHCGIDAVLGDACGLELSDEFLSAMNKRFFHH